SEILFSHSYSPITSAVLLSHRLFNPHLRISQTRRLSSRVQSHHLFSYYHDLAFSSSLILNTDERDARQRRILT
ncbi:unnamed protein product, partial [Brassica rapa subsp. narinosa]